MGWRSARESRFGYGVRRGLKKLFKNFEKPKRIRSKSILTRVVLKIYCFLTNILITPVSPFWRKGSRPVITAAQDTDFRESRLIALQERASSGKREREKGREGKVEVKVEATREEAREKL